MKSSGSSGWEVTFALVISILVLSYNGQAKEKKPLTKEQRLAMFEEALEDIQDEDLVEKFLSEFRTPTKYIATIMDFFNTTVRLEFNVLQMLKVDGTERLKVSMDETLKGIAMLNKRIKNFDIKEEDASTFDDFVDEVQEEYQDMMNAFVLQYQLLRGFIEDKHDYIKSEFKTLLKTQEDLSDSWVRCKQLGLVLDEDNNYKTDEAYREHVENYERNGDIELEAIEALSDIQDFYDHIDSLVAELENKIAMEKIDGKKNKFFKEYNEIVAFHEKALEFIDENAEELSLIKTSLEANLLYLKDLLKKAADKYMKEIDTADLLMKKVDKAEMLYKKELAILRLTRKYLISPRKRDEF